MKLAMVISRQSPDTDRENGLHKEDCAQQVNSLVRGAIGHQLCKSQFRGELKNPSRTLDKLVKDKDQYSSKLATVCLNHKVLAGYRVNVLFVCVDGAC